MPTKRYTSESFFDPCRWVSSQLLEGLAVLDALARFNFPIMAMAGVFRDIPFSGHAPSGRGLDSSVKTQAGLSEANPSCLFPLEP